MFQPTKIPMEIPEWQTNYAARFLVVDLFSKVNAVIQKSDRADKLAVLIDTCKPFVGDAPTD